MKLLLLFCYGLNKHSDALWLVRPRCSTIQGIFVHHGFIAANIDDSGMFSLGTAAMVDAR